MNGFNHNKINLKSSIAIKEDKTTELQKEDNGQLKQHDKKINIDHHVQSNISPKQLTLTRTKNINVNLWRKNSGNPNGQALTYGSNPQEGVKNVMHPIKPKTVGTNKNSESKVVSSPIGNQMPAQKEVPVNNLKESMHSTHNIDCNNYMTNYNTNVNVNINLVNDNLQSEILSSIINFKTLLKSNESASNMEKLFKSEESLSKLNQLNHKLNSISKKDEGNTLHKTEPIKPVRNINVINANMLSNDFSPKNLNPNEDVLENIRVNSDNRIKRYEILLDFISSNLKEINQLVSPSGQENVREEPSCEKLSSLHSKINLTNNLDKENGYDYEDTEMQEKTNLIIPTGKLGIREEVESNISKIKSRYYKKDSMSSLLFSSLNSEFYKNLLDDTNQLGHHEISIEMGSIFTQSEHQKKLEKFFGNDCDITQMRQIVKNKTINNNAVFRGDNRILPQHEYRYREGEENVEESDLDKTKENIQILDPR